MSSDTRTRLAIGGIVVLVAAMGAGLFLLTGSTEVVWATMIGLPIVIVAGIALYVRGLLTQTKTSETQYVQKRAGSVAETFQSELRTFNDLQTTYPKWTPNMDARIDSLVSDFDTQGVTVERDSGSFEVTGAVKDADIQELDRLETETETIGEEIYDEFETFVGSEIHTMDESIERLQDHDLVGSDLTLSPVPDSETVPALRDTLDSARAETTTTLTTAIEAVREMSRGDIRPDDIEFVESELETAENDLETDSYYSASDSILEAQDRLRDQFSGSFDTERKSLLQLLDTALDSGVGAHVDGANIDDLKRIKREITSLDSALEIAELTRYRSDIRAACVDIIRSMQQDLDDAAQTMRSVDLPSGYYTKPDVVGASLADPLEATDDIDRFRAEFADAAAQLTDALDSTTTKASVVDAYDDFAETIETELQRSGVVTGDDLPVRHAEQFLGLYNRRNPSVEFDPDRVALRLGDVEEYDVTVDLAFPQGGEPRDVTVNLDGPNHSDSASVQTRVAASIEFTDVPYGTYTISSDPGVDGFGTVTQEVSIEDDVTLSVEFEERSLRDQLCADVEQDIEDHLSAIDSQISSSFQEQGYVSTEMDFPIRDSYAPCLIATWGERNNYDLTRGNSGVIVYDREQIKHEVENIIRYNIDSGSELTFDEARENFLSVPVPSEVIRDMVSELNVDGDVTTSSTAIRMD